MRKTERIDLKMIAHLVKIPHSSDEQLSTVLDTSVRTVQRSLQRLKDSGIVTVKTTKFQLGGNWVNTRHVEVNS
jgi:predicted transcriptional regulator